MGDGGARHTLGWLRWARRRPWIYLLLFLIAVFGIFGLLFLGDRGSYLVTVLSLLVSFLGLVVALLPKLPAERSPEERSPSGPRGSRRERRTPPRPPDEDPVPRRRIPWRTVLPYAATLALGGLVAWGGYTLLQGTVPVPPDQAVTIENARDLTPDQPARVVFRGTTPDRAYLGLRLSLDDYLGSGDCTTYAGATLVPHLGGIQGRPVEVEALGTATQEPSETPIETGGAVNDLTVDVYYRADPGCRVELTVTGATFYGRY